MVTDIIEHESKSYELLFIKMKPIHVSCYMVKTHVVGCISCSELTLSTNHVPCFEICALHGSGNLCDGLASI